MPRAKQATSPEKPAKRKSSATPRNGNSLATATIVNVEEAIRARAYELYLQRGAADGQAEQDWVRAEQEIRARCDGLRSA